jgi:tetratricopeptide (TPR) repeat protein
MDAQQYYIRGIAAVKKNDMVGGRKLLLQSLKLNKNNDKAWIWVAKTLAEPDKKLQCADRALAINPQNTDALKLQQAMNTHLKHLANSKPKNSKADLQKIKMLFQEAETLVKTNRRPEAVDKWVMVLDIQSDHEEAMKNAIDYFMERKMIDEVEMLLYNAIDHGTENATLLLSARDLAEQRKDVHRMDTLNEKIASTEWVTSKQILKMANGYVKHELLDNGIRILQSGLISRPDDPTLLNRIAEIHEMTGKENLALQYYEKVANQNVRSKLAKDADKRLSQAVPVMTDRERSSTWLAWREVWGVFLLFFLFAFQDSGLSFLKMGANRWMGVLLSLVGGYLVITATSSPQQTPLAKILGGRLPKDNPKSPIRKLNPFASIWTLIGIEIDEESYYVGPIHEPSKLPIIPSWIRIVFGVSGCVMLIFAFYLVLPTALGLLARPELHLDTEFYKVMSD